MQPGALSSQEYDIGKCCLFYTDPVWAGTDNLFAAGGPLTFLGISEGEVRIEANPEYSELTLPESTGPSAIKRYLTGTRPTFEIGLFADLDQMKVVSPTGLASMGAERQRLAKTYTLWLAPEALFLKPNAAGFNQVVPVVFDGSAWTKDGIALTAEEERLLNLSAVIWKADFAPLTPTYRHEDGGKALSQVAVTVQHDFTRPEGCQQILVLGEAFGEYPAFTIDFAPI